MVECRWAGELWNVLPQRAIFWARRRTLCIADMHLGKAAAYRASGIPVPESATAADLARLDALVLQSRCQRLVILGDLIHARAGRIEQTMTAFARWRAEHPALDVLLIRGNHDVSAGDPPAGWGIRVENECFADPGDGDITFAHFPNRAIGPTLCGHLHPAVALDGPTRSLRAPCAWFGSVAAVLPAFGSFTGMKVIHPAPGDQVFALGDEVVDVTPPRVHATT